MAARHATAQRERASAAREASPPPPPAEERADVYARVTDAIVAAIESGAAKGKDWRMPWHRRRDPDGSPMLPVNVARGAAYRGVNTLALWAAAEAKGYRGRGHICLKTRVKPAAFGPGRSGIARRG